MARLPVLGTGDLIQQKQLPAHLDPTAMATASTADRNRANHTGTQTSATVSDFAEAAQDAIAVAFSNGTQTNITISYDDNRNAFNFTAAAGGSGGGGTGAPAGSRMMLMQQSSVSTDPRVTSDSTNYAVAWVTTYATAPANMVTDVDIWFPPAT